MDIIITSMKLDQQLKLKAVLNQATTATWLDSGDSTLALPLRNDGWRKSVSFLFRFPEEKVFEFDKEGTEILRWSDGKTTFETMIDRYMKKWELSFFEARGLLMNFFKPLIQKNIIFFVD